MRPPTLTRVEVRADPVRPRCLLVQGPLAARRLRPGPAGELRLALVATTALLLADDRVRIEVDVEGPVRVDLVEPAGTVAYDMRGAAARWDVEVRLRDGARLAWGGETFVVCGGATVDRSLTITLGAGCAAAVRERLVLGRSGEQGGELRTSTRVDDDHGPVVREHLDLSAAHRHGPGVLGRARCLESVSTYGVRLPEATGTLQAGRSASVVRALGVDAHAVELPAAWADARVAVGRGVAPAMS